MNTTGLPELWHIVLAILSRQEPFIQIMLVTLAALFVVMALEGFRSSIRAIWHAHRPPSSGLDAQVSLAAPARFMPRTRSFIAKPARSSRPKTLDQPPRQFRTPRPTIRRVPGPAGENGASYQVQPVEADSAAISLPAESAP